MRRSMSASKSVGTDTSPFLLTRNFPLKFHVGSLAPVSSLKKRQTSGAVSPLILPNFIMIPEKFFDFQNFLIFSSLTVSPQLNSRLGNARMTRFLPHRAFRRSN
uniref:Uncharacterized protein n=1 Tax=Pseudo-nitzschia australis TaxID=44445 RepID=A0A7S4EGM5_9STRA